LTFEVVNLGRLSYADAYTRQVERVAEVREGRAPSTLFLVEHPPVLTLGAAFHEENLLFSRESYAERGIQVEKTDRGGDVTYHGPGQLVAYPVFDLEPLGKDLHAWLRLLEEIVIEAIGSFGVQGQRLAVNSGVWVGENKICAMGIKVRRWVSFHGIALNCNIDLAPFGLIVPCGITGHGVTSMTQELGREVTVEEVSPVLIESFKKAVDKK
jgi:lipoyl(octanoyl) transferase